MALSKNNLIKLSTYSISKGLSKSVLHLIICKKKTQKEGSNGFTNEFCIYANFVNLPPNLAFMQRTMGLAKSPPALPVLPSHARNISRTRARLRGRRPLASIFSNNFLEATKTLFTYRIPFLHKIMIMYSCYSSHDA